MIGSLPLVRRTHCVVNQERGQQWKRSNITQNRNIQVYLSSRVQSLPPHHTGLFSQSNIKRNKISWVCTCLCTCVRSLYHASFLHAFLTCICIDIHPSIHPSIPLRIIVEDTSCSTDTYEAFKASFLKRYVS